MAVGRFDFDVLHVFFRADQGFHQFMRTFRCKTPVAAEAGHEEFGLHACERSVQVVAEIGGGIKIIQRLGHEQVGVGIEAVGKFVALVAQIAFHFKFNTVSVLQLATPHLTAELLAQPVFSQISDVPHHAGNLQAAPGNGLAAGVVAFVEVGIGEDSLAGYVVKCDVLSGQFGRRSNH